LNNLSHHGGLMRFLVGGAVISKALRSGDTS
jgi:hypothetical protein